MIRWGSSLSATIRGCQKFFRRSARSDRGTLSSKECFIRIRLPICEKQKQDTLLIFVHFDLTIVHQWRGHHLATRRNRLIWLSSVHSHGLQVAHPTSSFSNSFTKCAIHSQSGKNNCCLEFTFSDNENDLLTRISIALLHINK